MALPLPLPSSVRSPHLRNCSHHPAARMFPRSRYPCDACNTVERRSMKKHCSRCDQLYRVNKKDWNLLQLLMNLTSLGSLACWRNDGRNELLWERITEDILAACMEDFNRSPQVVRFEVLTTAWPENSTYSSASNCVFPFVCLFVCLWLFNNVVSNSGHVKHEGVFHKTC